MNINEELHLAEPFQYVQTSWKVFISFHFGPMEMLFIDLISCITNEGIEASMHIANIFWNSGC